MSNYLRAKGGAVLKYLVQVTEDLLLVAILSGFVFAFSKLMFEKRVRRIVLGGSLVGWLAAIVLAVLKNTTKLVDSGFWNLIFVGTYLVGLLAFLLMQLPPLAHKLGATQDAAQAAEHTQAARPAPVATIVQAAGLALVLLGAVGYMAPESLGYPWAIAFAVSTLVSTDFFFRIVGWLLGLVLMFLLGFGTCKVVVALGERVSRVTCCFGVVFVGALLAGLGLRALITRRLIPQNHTLFQIAVWASNANLMCGFVMATVAIACVAMLIAASVRANEPYDNPAQHRKIRAKWRTRKRWAVATTICVAFSLLNVTAVKAYDSKEVELSPSEDFELRDDGCYVSLEQVGDGHLHRFTYTTENDVGIRFIVIQKPGGTAYGIGLDACDICGETGYYERDGQVVCKLCDVVMNVQTIGFKGGCNPIVIDYDIQNGYIHVPFESLLEHEEIFTR